MSAQRFEQNGRVAKTAGFPQMGQGFAGDPTAFSAKGFLDFVAGMGSAGARVIGSDPDQPSNIGRKAFAGKEGHGLLKWQTNARRIRANEFLGEATGKTLDRIAAGLAVPLARSEIGLDLGSRQPFEAQPRFDKFLARAAFWRDEADRGVPRVRPPRQKPQGLRRLRHNLAFRQNAAADADDRVGPDDIGTRKFRPARSNGRGGSRFFLGEPRGESPRQLVLARSFVEIGGKHGIWFDADLLQEVEPPGRRRGQNKPWPPSLIAAGHGGSPSPVTGSFEPVGNAALGQVVGGHFHENLIASENADSIFAHLSRRVGDDLMVVLELDAKGGIREQFDDGPRKFEQFFLRHLFPCNWTAAIPRRPGRAYGADPNRETRLCEQAGEPFRTGFP